MSLKEEGPGSALTAGKANFRIVRLLSLQEPNISKSSPTNAPPSSLTQTL